MRLVVKAMRFFIEQIVKLLSLISLRIQISGNNVRIHGPIEANGIPRIVTFKAGSIVIGNKFRFNSGSHFNVIGRNQKLTFHVWGSLRIGNNVRMSGTTIICKEEINIGDDVLIGGNVVIYDTNFHSLYSAKRNALPEEIADVDNRPVIIEKGAFIGGHTTILKGVIIGECAIIGACSLVSTNIPPHEMWGGNPAKFIRKV